MKLIEIGARVESRAVSYIRDHFVHDFTSFEGDGTQGVFHKPNEDVLVQVRKVGSVMNVDELVRKTVSEVERHSEKQQKSARMYLVVHGSSDKTPEELLDKVSRGRDYDKVRVLYLKESSIPFDGRTAFTLYDT
jgi:hypothetical protein